MKTLQVDRTKLITPSEYARLKKVSPAAVTKMMREGRVEVVEVIGGKLIYLK